MKTTTIVYRFIMFWWRINPLKKWTAQMLRWLNIPVGELYRDFRFEGDFTVRYKNKKLRLHHYGSTTIENEIFWKGLGVGWEKVSIDYWTELCCEATVIMDIGANTGIYGLLANKFNPDAQVFCFEPAVATFQKLKRNASINQLRIECLQVAVSNHDGTANFFDFEQSHQYSASLNPIFSAGQKDVKTYSVQTKKLSSFIMEQQLAKIDLMKIDVELHEPEVLEGMGQYLQQFKPIILTEVLTDEAGQKIESLLANLDYCFYDIDEKHAPAESLHIKKSSSYNVLLLPREKLHFIINFIQQH